MTGARRRLHEQALAATVADLLERYEDEIPDGIDPLNGLLEVVTRTGLMAKVLGQPCCQRSARMMFFEPDHSRRSGPATHEAARSYNQEAAGIGPAPAGGFRLSQPPSRPMHDA